MKIIRVCSTKNARLPSDGSATFVDAVSEAPNVSVETYLDDTRTQFQFSHRGRDLVELGMAVYLADECVARNRAVDYWSRTLDFDFPVHAPSSWTAAVPSLQRTLKFLSGDHCEFAFPARRAVPPLARHRPQFSRVSSRRPFDRVCLFSGGVDSLLGAIRYLENGEHLLLLGHYADTATSAAQRTLAATLRQRFPGQAKFAQFRIQRHRGAHRTYPLPKKVERTHRTRSFLFLTLAAACADSFGIGRISIPENGLIALNPPLEVSRVGALSTRTAHPIYLLRVLQFFHEIGLDGLLLENPFLFESKTDMVSATQDWTVPLLKRSVSCARPNQYQDRGVRHCGYCVPCLYRRAGFIRRGIDAPNEYAFDVLQTLGALTNDLQGDARAMVRFARRVTAASDTQLLAVVLSHGYFAPESGQSLGGKATSYAPWTEMIRRWATAFLEDVHRKASPSTLKIVGMPRRVRNR